MKQNISHLNKLRLFPYWVSIWELPSNLRQKLYTSSLKSIGINHNKPLSYTATKLVVKLTPLTGLIYESVIATIPSLLRCMNLIRSLYKVKIYLKFTFTFLFLNTALSATRCGQAWVNTCFLYVDYVRAIRGPPRDNKHRWQTGSNYIRVFDIVLQFKRAKCKKRKEHATCKYHYYIIF